MNILSRFKGWALSHPNTMVYIAIVCTLNFFINIAQVVTGH